MKILCLAFLAGTCLCISPVFGSVLTFDELTGPVKDIPFEGVTFDFLVDGVSSDAFYEMSFPGISANLSGGVLFAGEPGIISLGFDTPSPYLGFAAAYLATGPNPFQVSLFGSNGDMLDFAFVLADSLPPCDPGGDAVCGSSEALYSFTSNSSPIALAVLDFSSAGYPFAIDNLSYEPAPEPGTYLLLIGGLIAFCLRSWLGPKVLNSAPER